MGVTYATKPKQPYEEIPIYIDFVNRLPSAETVLTYAVTCVDQAGTSTTATMIKGVSASGSKVYFTYYGGTDGCVYKATVKCTSANAKAEEDFVFNVREY